jgi:hypothetical protein
VLVRLRTGAVNSVCGLAKPCGDRLPASSTLCFAKRRLAVLPPGLAEALSPLLQQIAGHGNSVFLGLSWVSFVDSVLNLFEERDLRGVEAVRS